MNNGDPLKATDLLKQGVTKRCRRLSWLSNSALVYDPKCVRRGVSCCTHGAQINFGDLTQYFIYVWKED
jgi:hypothetical protein